MAVDAAVSHSPRAGQRGRPARRCDGLAVGRV